MPEDTAQLRLSDVSLGTGLMRRQAERFYSLATSFRKKGTRS